MRPKMFRIDLSDPLAQQQIIQVGGNLEAHNLSVGNLDQQMPDQHIIVFCYATG